MGKDDNLEKEFAQLGGHSVDAELAALKAERQKGSPAPPYIAKELPSPGGSLSTGAKVGEKTGA